MSQILVNKNSITDTTRNSTFTYEFERTIDLTDRKIALSGLSLYYSWKNITEKNNKLSYVWTDGIEYQIELPVGYYEINDIYSYCRFVMTRNKHYLIDENNLFVFYFELSINNTTYSIDILTYPVPTILPSGYTAPDGFIFQGVARNPVIKIPSELNEILGYEKDFETEPNVGNNSIKKYSSSQAPNVNPNNSILIVCDEVSNEFNALGVLYSLAPSVSISSLIDEKVPSLLYSNLKSGRFDKLTFRILNARTYEPMEIFDPEINLRFSIV